MQTEDEFFIDLEEKPLQRSGHVKRKNNDTENVIMIKCSRKGTREITQNKTVQVVKKIHPLTFWLYHTGATVSK
jgi:hypothetical protein